MASVIAKDEAYEIPMVEGTDNRNLLKVLKVAKRNFKRAQSETPEISEEEAKSLRKSIWKNLFLLCMLMFTCYTSWNSVVNLQSSINADIGTIAVMICWMMSGFAPLFLPSIFLNILTYRQCIIYFIPGMLSDIIANFYPRPYTLWVTAVIVGLTFGVAWTAALSYIAQIANRYSELSKQEYDVVVAQFLGIFFLFVQSTNIFGNLISSLVLPAASEVKILAEVQQHCGAYYDPFAAERSTVNDTLFQDEDVFHVPLYNNVTGNSTDNETNIDEKVFHVPLYNNVTGNLEPEVSDVQRYTLISIFTGIALGGIIITAIFLDPLEKLITKTKEKSKKSLYESIFATLNHMHTPYQVMLLPINILVGMQLGFMQVSYTKAFVTCGLGVHMIGYIMAVFGTTDAASSLFSSYLRNTLGRIPVFTMAFILHLTILCTLLFWSLDPNAPAEFFVIAACWGCCDGIWMTQINALYGTMFEDRKDEAFSTFKLVHAFAFAAISIMSAYMSVLHMLYILITVLVVGFVMYIVVELIEFNGGLNNTKEDLKKKLRLS